jgi:hypothetical protein
MVFSRINETHKNGAVFSAFGIQSVYKKKMLIVYFTFPEELTDEEVISRFDHCIFAISEDDNFYEYENPYEQISGKLLLVGDNLGEEQFNNFINTFIDVI